MKKSILILMAGLYFQASFAQENKKSTQPPQCIVVFKMGSAEVDKKALNKCMSQFNLKDINYIEIFTTSSPEGGLAYNHKLSDKRAKSLTNELKNLNAEIDIKNGGSSFVYGRQGTIVFLKNNPNKTITCPIVTAPIAKTEIVKEVEIKTNTITHLDDVYFGMGVTFISSSIANYTGKSMITYNVGLNHKFYSFTLFGGDSSLYFGGDLMFALKRNTLSATTTATQTSVLYVRNNYGFVFGVERSFHFYKPLSLFLEIGPALQERIFILTDTNSATEDAFASREMGAIANLGMKLNFLEKSPTLAKVGIDNLFVRTNLNGSYGLETKTRTLTYDGGTPDINQFSWSALLGAGFSF